MNNYEKALELVKKGIAKKLKYTGCILFNLGYNTVGFIYPNDVNVTVDVNADDKLTDYNYKYDCGFIDLDTMSIIGIKDNYSIEKYSIHSSEKKSSIYYWRKQGTEEQLFPIFFYI